MGEISDTQVAFRSKTSANALLSDFLDNRLVDPGHWVEAQKVTLGGSANYALITSAMISGNIAKGTSTATDGYIAAALPGAVGTGSTNTVTNSGEILNLSPIRVAGTHDSASSSGLTVYGLFQTSAATADGSAIGAAASENVQLSFVVIETDGTLTLTSISAGTYEFVVPSVVRLRNLTDFRTLGNPLPRQVLGSGASLTARAFTVTASYAANEVVTLSTGAGAGTGTSSVSSDENDTINLGANASAFNTDHGIQVYLNGLKLQKGVDVIWDSSGSFHVTKAMHVNEHLSIVKTA